MVSGNPWIFHHLGHDNMYIAEVTDVVEEPVATPLYCISSTFITLLIYTEDVTLCKYCCQVHCYETFHFGE